MSEQRKTIVVIGGVAAGASAAAKARREDEQAEICVFEKGEYVSFANCGLPYYVGDEIKNKKALLLHTPESLKARFNLDVYVNQEVVEIKPEEHMIVTRDRLTGAMGEKKYDKLIIATGAKPIVPPIEGIQSANVQLLRTVPEAEQLKLMVQSGQVKKAVVIGGGFIGLEAVENLHRQGVQVILVEKADQVMTPFDKEMVTYIEDELRSMGVRLILGNGVQKFITSGDKAVAVALENGEQVEADVFLLSIGVRPDVALAQNAGIKLGKTGAIEVNEYMETSVEDIYAAGDVVEIKHLANEQRVWIPLAGPANKQGRVAGANAAGRRMTFKGALGTSIVRVGKVVAGKTGLSEKECQRNQINYRVTYNYHGDHAGYYPGAENMMIKLISEKESGRILGVQIVGGHGVDKRVDVVATAIYGGMTVEDLENLDLAYAPPFGAAKDPIIMAGMNHSNSYRGEIETITPRELTEKLQVQPVQLIDVRNPNEWKAGIIEGALTIPLDELREKLDQLDPDKETVVYCRSGQRSYFGSCILRNNGFKNIKNLTGGYLSWEIYQKSQS